MCLVIPILQTKPCVSCCFFLFFTESPNEAQQGLFCFFPPKWWKKSTRNWKTPGKRSSAVLLLLSHMGNCRCIYNLHRFSVLVLMTGTCKCKQLEGPNTGRCEWRLAPIETGCYCSDPPSGPHRYQPNFTQHNKHITSLDLLLWGDFFHNIFGFFTVICGSVIFGICLISWGKRKTRWGGWKLSDINVLITF